MVGWVVVTFKAPRELVEELDRLRLELGLTRSEVVREALACYLRMARSGGADSTRGGEAYTPPRAGLLKPRVPP